MTESHDLISAERWADWWLQGRSGGDGQRLKLLVEGEYPARERVLQNARLQESDTVLDIGTGDGLVGFAVLSRVGHRGRVTFCDISSELLSSPAK